MKELKTMTSDCRRRLVRVACLTTLATLTACNPTWTKDGAPNDNSMPLPPDARAPKQAGGEPAQAPAAKP